MTYYKGKRNKADILSGVKHNIVSSKFVANNTVEYFTEDGRRIIRLHDTDILVFEQEKSRGYKNDLVYIYTDGWKTPTTKDRLNNFGKGFSIWQEKRRWYISDKMGNKSLFYEGAVVQNGCLTRIEEKDSRTDKLEKLINKYCDKIGRLKQIPLPSNGDCWYCLFVDTKTGKPWGDEDTDHLINHLEEQYVHGSLIVNALRARGRRDAGISLIIQNKITDIIRRDVRRYFRGKLGLVT